MNTDRRDTHRRDTDRVGRGRGRRGTAIITVCVLLFAVTAGAIVFLARDVNRSVSNRSVAQSVAFQTARAGAQQVDLEALRGSGSGVDLELDRARSVGASVADELFASYGVDGELVAMTFDGSTVTVEVVVRDAAGDQAAVGTAEPRTGPRTGP